MASVSESTVDRALLAAFSGRLSLGLLSGDLEQSAEGYQRRPVVLGTPETVNGGRVLTNSDDIVFAPYEITGLAVDGWALFSGDEEVARGGLLTPKLLDEGDQFVIRRGLLRFGMGGTYPLSE